MKNSGSFHSLSSSIEAFLRLETAGGVVLLVTTVFALVVANSPLAGLYASLLEMTLSIQVGTFSISKPLLLWVNDGLMAIFFFLIGLEIKREILEGELSSFSQIVLPGLGALGGMIVPAAVYALLNWSNSEALNGWAIPVATDIAFALALLAAFGSRVPTSLKVFLLTLAIFDDLAAIVIIAIFYSGNLSPFALTFGALTLGAGILLNKLGVTRTSVYVMLGVVLWAAVLKSGVHATLAGVLIAFCIPMRDHEGDSPLKNLEQDLHFPVAFAVLPIFAFCNAGISLPGITYEQVVHPVTIGIIAGLFLGKPIGILLFISIPILLGAIRLPSGVTWSQITGVSFACGIGFTMSLFIAGLAFEHGSTTYFAGDRPGILIGSILAAVCGYILLSISLKRNE